MEKIIAKLFPLNVKQLKEMATKLNEDLSKEASIVLDAVLNQLEEKMTEDEFISFADSL